MGTLEVLGVVQRLSGLAAPVLDGLDLTIAPGETIGIAGANGAGKTTLLRVIAGLLVPDAGRVSLGRLTPERDTGRYHRRVALLSADGGLYARLSVRRHLEWWAAMCFVPGERRAQLADRALADFGLAELGTRRAERLSAGQRQRLRLAMTFLPEPALALLDEPDARLDEDGLGLLAERIARHTAEGGLVAWTAPEGRTGLLPCDGLRHLREGRLA